MSIDEPLGYAMSAVSVTLTNLKSSLEMLMATIIQLDKVEIELDSTKAELERLQTELAALEARWRKDAKESSQGAWFRQTLEVCADELAKVRGNDDNQSAN